MTTVSDSVTKGKGLSMAVPADPLPEALTSSSPTDHWLSRYIPGPAPRTHSELFSPRRRRIGLVACGCSLLMFSGFNVALMGNVSAIPSYLKIVGLDDGTNYTQLLIGVINSLYWVGVFLGAALISPLSDRVGRRKALVLSAILGLLIIPILAGLQNFAWAITVRFLNGFITGFVDSVGLNLCAETADRRHRGRTVGFMLVSAATGAAQAYFLVYGMSKHTDSQIIWRLPLAYQALFITFLLMIIWLLPESPRWLCQHGYYEEARRVLISLTGDRGTEYEVHSAAEYELGAIYESVADRTGISYFAMFFKKDAASTRRRTWSALFLQFSTQAFVGVGVATGYGMKIFEAGGWSSDTSALLAGAGILTQAVFGIPGALFADKIGRRRALVWGSFNGSIILCFIGICGHFVARYSDTDPVKTKQWSTAVVELTLLWSAQFGLTWLWAPFVYPSEIFPSKCRAKGSSFGMMGLASGAFFINMISPYIFAAIGYKAMFLLCGLSMLVSVVCYFTMPETANKTLEEIDQLFK